METTRPILVIGGGPAGTFAAIAAKKQNPDARVVLLTEEPCEPYEKPPLSKGVLVGKVLPADAPIAGPGGLAAHGVVLECHARCQAIDRDARTLVLEDGRRLPYGTLVIATGSLVRELPHLPVGMPHVHYLRTEADAQRLTMKLRETRRLLVVGAGLIGLEVAASAAELGRPDDGAGTGATDSRPRLRRGDRRPGRGRSTAAAAWICGSDARWLRWRLSATRRW